MLVIFKIPGHSSGECAGELSPGDSQQDREFPSENETQPSNPVTEDMFESARQAFFGNAKTSPQTDPSSGEFRKLRNEVRQERFSSPARHGALQPAALAPGNSRQSSTARAGSSAVASFSRASFKTRIKTHLLRSAYWLAYHLAGPVVYSRQPFVRYPYMNPPSEIMELTKQLLSVDVPGTAVEVGCNQGWTTCFLNEALAEHGVRRDYVCIDTFTGFTLDDVTVEYESRGKAAGTYNDSFLINDPQWLNASVKRFGYSNVTVHAADATTFDYQSLGKIAFALVDVDLYRPVKESLNRIIPQMAQGGVVVVDDCDPNDPLWDGAYQAFTEFCKERSITPEIVCRKLGIIRT